jgi:DNA (cytosine-5)-methyltransferase 1
MGYSRAGFTEIVGIDLKPQPRYPFRFIQGDALRPPVRLEDFDAIHASPPCQAYSSATAAPSEHPDLYVETRDMLTATGLPWAIENVIGAPCRYGLVLCGTMFGLERDGEWLRRHRTFETPFLILHPYRCRHRKERRAITVTGHCFLTVTKDCARHSRQGTFELSCALMGIDWMTRKELTQAIPPAYTEFIGRQLIAAIDRERVA